MHLYTVYVHMCGYTPTQSVWVYTYIQCFYTFVGLLLYKMYVHLYRCTRVYSVCTRVWVYSYIKYMSTCVDVQIYTMCYTCMDVQIYKVHVQPCVYI